MKSQERILELEEEIKELGELLAKAEQNKDLEGRWVVYLLKSLLERRTRALKIARTVGITWH